MNAESLLQRRSLIRELLLAFGDELFEKPGEFSA